ncbi:heavy metal translocating P-type ATPase [Christiangramia flava]|uniref:P-type Zn(2+) transporter n=1 Tax=Christiangramia flava JLT2011 TaxID=1229726 RepID=A0A1L7I591_9FLAO|nr:heavy metal translocating P-type ATPase [Christiangramia flava]APU68778.1 Lead, cadmium, zinc and mercury transporting ATPase [Christiangramia flava JLT2011]OSS39077.1 Lead, cadmium, zinc and mercury transporting ATPase [Christiangramia flava JLT2011]
MACSNCNGKSHSHDHSAGFLGEKTELYFAILSGIFLIGGYLLHTFTDLSEITIIVIYAISYIFGGFFTLKEAIQEISHGRFEIDFLMLVAAIGAAFLNKWAEGALLLFLFSLGHALEHMAMEKARKSIESLTNLSPKTALKKVNGNFEEVAVEDLQVGDIIRVKPNSAVSADGVVVSGKSSVNQAPITGESIPVDKEAHPEASKEFSADEDINEKNRVFAGSINGDNVLEIYVIREYQDSTLQRLVNMVQEAQEKKSPTQLLADKFEKYYVPAVLILIVLLNFAFLVIDETWSESFYRSMAALVAASPCALAISTPSAVLSGIARAGKGGVLIKGGKPLEDLGTLRAIAFDKTGTLTEGKPKLTDFILLNDAEKEQVYAEIIALENTSNHPLARAIVRDGKKEFSGNLRLPEVQNVEAVQGKGITGEVSGEMIKIGNLELFENVPQDTSERINALEKEGKTVMLAKSGSDFVAILALMDVPREAAKETLSRLQKIGIRKMIMLTGDNQEVAQAVAKEIGLTDAYGSLLPQEKVDKIKELKKSESKIAMVGDGVNDAPAIANSTVGIAMGAAGSDVALETADVALMADKLEILPFAIALSRKSRQIIKQNLWISLGVVALLLPSTIFGLANIGIAVVFHEGSTIVVVLNALRLLGFNYRS